MSMSTNVIRDVVDKTLKAIESSKDEIYKIVENARTQVNSIREELRTVQEEIRKVIEEVDNLERKDRLMRQKLVQVSKDFSKFSEEDVKQVYDTASEVRVDFKMKEQEELTLRSRRSSLELNLKQAEEILRSAEKLISQVSVAMNFLSGELGQVNLVDEETSFEYGVKMLETLENERRKISREIHDGPAQSMANLVMKADIVKLIFKRDIEKGFEEIDALKEAVRDTLREIRHILYELRPGPLEQNSLKYAVESLIADFKKFTQCEVDFKCNVERADVESNMQIAVYRLIQEALNNVKKHAEAKHVSIIMEYTPIFIVVKITDDGKGFNVENVFGESSPSDSYGLKGMKERVEQITGEFKCESQLDSGTKVVFKVPINKEVMRNVHHTD